MRRLVYVDLPVLDFLAQAKAVRDYSVEQPTDPHYSWDSWIVDRLHYLTDTQERILTLLYRDGWTRSQVSSKTGLSRAQVAREEQRAIVALRSIAVEESGHAIQETS